MKTIYFDLGMGAAGDMLTAALLELMPDKDEAVSELNALGIPGVEYVIEKSIKCGITGTHMTVLVEGHEEGEEHHGHTHHDGEHHHHSGMDDIEHIVCSHLNLPENVRNDVMSVYRTIAEAESEVHGVPVTDIHFHEVGTMDAIADVTAVCWLMNRLQPDEVIASPVHVGSGTVHCAHGILPVPAPATAKILMGIPVYGGKVRGELCTPTGAALIRRFVTKFGDMPVMKIDKIGYGMGKKDFETANCVRAFSGETEDAGDTITELSCNVDDMTGERIGFAMERLFEAGALDVYTESIGMKKNRPGTMIRVMCNREDRDKIVKTIFLHTTTIGIREQEMKRYKLERRTGTVLSPYGEIRKKTVSGFGVSRSKLEYDDLSRIARENGISIREVEESCGQ